VTLGPHKKSLKNVLDYAAILLNESDILNSMVIKYNYSELISQSVLIKNKTKLLGDFLVEQI
jgi:hypothetical protein